MKLTPTRLIAAACLILMCACGVPCRGGDMNYAQKLEKSDADLNAAYQKVMRLLAEYPSTGKNLQKSELAWIKYRDLNVSLTLMLPSEMQLPADEVRNQKMFSMTSERAGDLGDFFVYLPEQLKQSTCPPWPPMVRTIDMKSFQETNPSEIPDIARVMYIGKYHTIPIFKVDLNDDGVPELLAIDRGASGNGGLCISIYRKGGNKYKKFGEIFGFSISLLEKKNGYYQIKETNKSGGGDYAADLIVYENGNYKRVRTDHWNECKGFEGTEFFEDKAGSSCK